MLRKKTGFITLDRTMLSDFAEFGLSPPVILFYIGLLWDAEFQSGKASYKGKLYNINRGQLIYTKAEVADFFGVTEGTVRNWEQYLIGAELLKLEKLSGRAPAVATLPMYSQHTKGKAKSQRASGSTNHKGKSIPTLQAVQESCQRQKLTIDPNKIHKQITDKGTEVTSLDKYLFRVNAEQPPEPRGGAYKELTFDPEQEKAEQEFQQRVKELAEKKSVKT